jgi:hypothetical protein
MRETSHKVIPIDDFSQKCSCRWNFEFKCHENQRMDSSDLIDIMQGARDEHFREVKENGGYLKQPLIYLASPHSHLNRLIRAQRYNNVLQATSYFISKGFWIFSPIVHSHYVGIVLEHNFNQKSNVFEYWKDFDSELITKCDEMWVLCIDGCMESKGVQAEIEIARLQGKRVIFVSPAMNSEARFWNAWVTFDDNEKEYKRAEHISFILNSND